MENKFQASYERFKQHMGDKLIGFLWEVERSNFKLVCYLVSTETGADPQIFQLWPDGNGFHHYAMVETFIEPRVLVLKMGYYGSNNHRCLWLTEIINGKKDTNSRYVLMHKMEFEEVYQSVLNEYIKNGYVVKFVHETD